MKFPLSFPFHKLGLSLAAFTALAAPEKTALAQGPLIEVEAQFLEFTEASYAEFAQTTGVLGSNEAEAILDPAKQKVVLDTLNGAAFKQRKVELLSAPRMTIKSKQDGEIEVAKEFKYPSEFQLPTKDTPMTPTAMDMKLLGVQLRLKPDLAEDGKTLQLHATPRFVEFFGYKNIGDKAPILNPLPPGTLATIQDVLEERFLPKERPGATADGYNSNKPFKPIFSEYTKEADFKLAAGQAALLRLARQPLEGETLPPDPRVFLVLVKARTLPDAAADGATAGEEKKTEAYPEAIVRPGDKPGFVRSPFAENAPLVDVRGFPPGTALRCPFTGKVFLIPKQ